MLKTWSPSFKIQTNSLWSLKKIGSSFKTELFADPAVGRVGRGGYSNGSEKSVTLFLTCFKTLFLLVISRVMNMDKTCKLGHSPAEVKLWKILNAGSCFESFIKCFHRAANPDVHRCMDTSTCMDLRQ